MPYLKKLEFAIQNNTQKQWKTIIILNLFLENYLLN